MELPVGSVERGGNNARSLLVSGSYQLDVLRRGAAPVEDREALRGVSHTFGLETAYGVTSWLTAAVVVPFALKSQTVRAAGDEVERRISGPGDPLVAARLTVLGHDKANPRAVRVGVLAGVKIPIGDYRASDALGRIPAVFQAGSGAFDLLAGANVWTVPARSLALTGALVLRQPTTNGEGYRFGSSLLATLDSRFDHLHPVSVTIGLRFMLAAADRLNGDHVHGSGGARLLARAGVVYHAGDAVAFNVDALVPMVSALSGDPLAPAVSLIAGATASF